VPATNEHLVARVVGEVELEEKILVVRRIHVKLELKAAAEHREVAERVHSFFAMSCPLYRTLRSAIAITTELVLLPV
jgi:uncharacterized OsmC-like protein